MKEDAVIVALAIVLAITLFFVAITAGKVDDNLARIEIIEEHLDIGP